MLVALAGMLAAGQACTIKVSDRTFDFTSLSGKQLLFNERNYNYQLTICQVAPEACSGYSSSLCQSDESFQFSLGVWSNFTNWRIEGGQLIATAQGVECPEIQKPRVTDITFVCGTEAKIMSMEEVAPCEYQMLVQVPSAVCSRSACCAPATFTSTRFEVGGKMSVVQRSASGDWFDGNYQGRGQNLLCSANYQRCFTFPASLASCVGSAYRPAPAQCFGGPDWNFLTQIPAVNNLVMQDVWVSTLDQSYVATTSIDGSSSCVAVSGSNIDTSAGFSLTPDESLWKVPQICLKELESKKKQKF